MSIKDCVSDILRFWCNKKSTGLSKDPLLNYRASTVRQYYQGYPYILRWGNDKAAWYYLQVDEARSWCTENCTGKVSCHIHRVIQSDSYGVKDEWVFNEIGGYDYCFWAFTKESDALMFSLKW